MEDNGFRCSVCSQSYNIERKVVTLNCGHYICSFCSTNNLYNKICLLCKSLISDLNLDNDYLIELFNKIYFSDNFKNTKVAFNYCINCNEIIFQTGSHQINFPNHKMINIEQLKDKISKIKKDFNRKIERVDLVDKYICLLKKLLLNDKFKTDLNKHFSDGLLKEMKENYTNIQKESALMKIKHYFSDSKENFVSNNLKNRFIFKKLTELLFQNYKFMINDNNFQQNKILVTYIKNTKKIILYDIQENTSEIFEISDLPFKFFKLSHSIAFHSSSNSVFISGGKQDNLIYSDSSRITWRYDTHKKSLTKLFETPNGISEHRAVFVNNFYYIIGGNNFTKYFDKIFKININPIINYEIKEYARLTIPRSSFGVSVINDSTIYVFLGETTDGKLLNSIEIINTKKSSKLSIIELKNQSIRLKDIGVIYSASRESFIVIGGKNSKNIQNKRLYYIKNEDFSVFEKCDEKLIAENQFVSLGLEINEVCSLLSNDRITGEDPQVLLYNSKNDKWTCQEINMN